MIKDIFIKKENQVMIGVVIISLFLISIGFYFLNKNGEDGLVPRNIPNSVETIKWKEYKNDKYNIDIQYPEHFKFFTETKTFGPAFNFYFDEGKNKLPFDHFVNQSHLSVYPEGVILLRPDHSEYYEQGDYTNSKGMVFLVREYKTYDKKTWAIMAKPKSVPKKWLEVGFIWISSEIKNKDAVCFDGDVKKSIDVCNVLEGDSFYVVGSVDEEFIKIGREILDKVSF